MSASSGPPFRKNWRASSANGALSWDLAAGGGLLRTKLGNSSLSSIRKASRSARWTHAFVITSVSTCATSLSVAGVGLADVVEAGRDSAEMQPFVPRHQAFDVGRSDDLEVVLVRQRADELGVLVHDEGGEIELTVANHFRLRFEAVIGGLQIEPLEVGILQQLLHHIGRAGAIRTDADRRSLQVVERIDRAPAPGEQEERLRLREPAQRLQAGVGRNRHSVLHEGEGGNAASVFAGEARDVLDRPRRGDDLQMAVLLEGARRQPVPDRVIASGR